jgi:hypothetical protein
VLSGVGGGNRYKEFFLLLMIVNNTHNNESFFFRNNNEPFLIHFISTANDLFFIPLADGDIFFSLNRNLKKKK